MEEDVEETETIEHVAHPCDVDRRRNETKRNQVAKKTKETSRAMEAKEKRRENEDLTRTRSVDADVKLTKDGNVLLREMQIQNPTAVMIARAAVAQDDVTGDGTSSTVILIGEIMRAAERYLADNVHPRVLVDGLEVAKRAAVEFLDKFKLDINVTEENPDREMLCCVAKTSLCTKVRKGLGEKLTDMVVDAVLTIRNPQEPIDLHMVEIMHMKHKSEEDSKLVKGLVLDHGTRHPDMKKHATNCYILTCNISLEYEKSEVNSGFFYSTAEQREKMVQSERAFTDERVQRVIDLKKKVCDGTDKNFVVINQKGIDPISLEMLAAEGIIALRRAKKRNMERLVLACGGQSVNTVEELVPEALGYAGEVYEHVLGDEKYTFVQDVANPRSCTLLLTSGNDHTLAQMKDAIRDGLRAVKNAIEDKAVVPGGGAFEIAAARHLETEAKKKVEGKAKLGVQTMADALLSIPKILAENSGFDAQETLINLQEEHEKGNAVGLDVATGEPMIPGMEGVYDNWLVKRQLLNSAPVIASQLLLVDEVMRAGRNMRKG